MTEKAKQVLDDLIERQKYVHTHLKETDTIGAAILVIASVFLESKGDGIDEEEE